MKEQNFESKPQKSDSYFFQKFFIPLASGSVINVGIFIFLEPSNQPFNQWILLLIYCMTFIPQAIDSYTKIKLAEIDATRQVKRDEIHQSGKGDGKSIGTLEVID